MCQSLETINFERPNQTTCAARKIKAFWFSTGILKYHFRSLIIETGFNNKRCIMRPSLALEFKRVAVREAASRFRVANPRIFGSVLHGTDLDGSDLDLLVDALPGATLLDLGDLQDELKSLLGVHVDLLTPGDLPPKFRAKVLAEAQPV